MFSLLALAIGGFPYDQNDVLDLFSRTRVHVTLLRGEGQGGFSRQISLGYQAFYTLSWKVKKYINILGFQEVLC